MRDKGENCPINVPSEILWHFDDSRQHSEPIPAVRRLDKKLLLRDTQEHKLHNRCIHQDRSQAYLAPHESTPQDTL